jgi:hypothetical protein
VRYFSKENSGHTLRSGRRDCRGVGRDMFTFALLLFQILYGKITGATVRH